MLTTVLFMGAMTLVVGEQSEPIARWEFGRDASPSFVAKGTVRPDQAGPRPPEFPDKAADNAALQMDATAYLVVPDTGSQSAFDFTNGDEVTLEAWVNPSSLREGQVSYIIGKGRTGSQEFARDNQNWSLRVVGGKQMARLSFLFATKLSEGDGHWHRWDSERGFPVGTGWHHVAIAYRFGDPKSIRGWINGKPTPGVWSYGGETTEPPVVDNDEVRIGNGFEGMLDGIAIHRAVLADPVIASRFQRVGPPRTLTPQTEVMPRLGDIPEGQVLVQLSEGLPAYDRWPNEGEPWPEESMQWMSDTFLLKRLPLQYDAWGIRTGWRPPVLLRMAGDVQLPAGQQRFLLRARSLGRLWIDGKLVARTEPDTKRPPDGEEPVTPVAQAPLQGMRPHGYHQQEVFGETVIAPGAAGTSRVVLELVVGGKGHRTESGEVCVAMLSADGLSYELLGGGASRLPLTDATVEPALVSIERSLAQLEDQRRRAAAASQDGFWQQRHALARDWVLEQRTSIATAKGKHPVDALIAAKIQRSLAAAKEADPQTTSHFYEDVLPILRENCFRCHGEKEQGGLKLNSRTALLQAGESELPAVVPGDPEASELVARIRHGDMPPTESGLSQPQIETLEQWVQDGALWPAPPLAESAVALAPAIGDAAFMRRVYLDTLGIPPTEAEAREFLSEQHPDKRERLIHKLLQDERFADGWMDFWLDLLAENPTLINASLNSTGPFRWFLYDSLRDNKPLDRMVTELIMLRGGAAEGGSAGFGIAAENDAPLAAKGHIVASAFLGIELQCARCHDSPYHSTTQQDLYALAAMFQRQPVKVPATSQVPAAFFENQTVRESLIQVTLEANASVAPEWPFAEVTGVADSAELDQLLRDPTDTRERLAALITAPQNIRFPRVVVNRIWKRLMGAGLVEPVHDWEGSTASHPELLDWLANELVVEGYDLRHVVQRIVSSQAYQRAAVGENESASPEMRFFNAPDRRRMSAEQIVDALHHCTGRPIDVEELTFVHDGRRELGHRQTLGKPTRAWMFSDLKNERDRPSLALPKARAVLDVLEAFGWTGARQMPIATREMEPNVLQPGILSGGTLTASLTRAANRSELAELAIAAPAADALVDSLFLRFFSRPPKPEERTAFIASLATGFESRLLPEDAIEPVEPLPELPLVTWFNHGRARANEIQLEIERRVSAGPPPDPRLSAEWRAVYEDAVWSLINHREFVWVP